MPENVGTGTVANVNVGTEVDELTRVVVTYPGADAVTLTLSRVPASAVPTRYVDAVAPAIAVPLRLHW
ncbi:hypothetical protein [Microbacterium testaceum]|uniref:hypothetical protein n=1 Tax=Microbacterium testaceum TaxID=2033 RepID=UPI0027D7E89A|nr:hypothetical protein [Microbacterium testaceum]